MELTSSCEEVSVSDESQSLPLQLEMYVESDAGENMFLREEQNPSHCGACDETFGNCEESHNHVCTRHPLNQWMCPVCGIHFPSVFYLKEHLKTHEQPGTSNKHLQNEAAFMNDASTAKKDPNTNLFYKCVLCDKQFASATELENHVRCHPSSSSHSFTLCKKDFKLPEALNMHMWSHAKYPADGSSDSAEICAAAVAQTIDLAAGKSQACVKVQTCDVCKKTFRNASYFQLHLRTHAGDKTYTCQMCGKSFSCSWNLKTHLAVHRDEKPYTCSVCGVGFKLKANMQRHERSHQPHEKLNAARVNSGASTNLGKNESSDVTTQNKNLSNFSGQLQPVSEPMDGPCSCSFCGKMFSCAAHLKSHLSVHIGTRPYSCSKCGMGFKVKANMIRHERLHQTSETPPSGQSNNDWSGRSTNESNMTTSKEPSNVQRSKENTASSEPSPASSEHERGRSILTQTDMLLVQSNKHDITSYPSASTASNKESSRKNEAVLVSVDGSNIFKLDLTKPVEVTTVKPPPPSQCNSDRRHMCRVCGKTYKQRCHLLSHMISHSDERPYVCEFCGKSFSLSWNLKTHLAVHNQDKPFTCYICGNSFKLKTALQRHERSHLNRGGSNASRHQVTASNDGCGDRSGPSSGSEPKNRQLTVHCSNITLQ